jgi:D-alanyl-D-alanine endopeptidase (penicillin-binding protein 7)
MVFSAEIRLTKFLMPNPFNTIILSSLLVLAMQSLTRPVNAQELALASVGAIAVDVQDNEILLAQNAEIVLPIASLTKVMTALVVVESGEDLDAWLTVEDWARKTGKNAYSRIRVTSQARRKDLLRVALMSSENLAAYNLAEHHPGGVAAFVDAMNAKADDLEMHDTRFADPTGLEVVGAHQHAVLNEFSTTRQFTVNFRQPRYRLGYGNTNPLTGSARWDVAMTKTGYLTEAGRCLLMVTEMAGRQVGVVLLNSLGTRSPLGDAGRIRRFLETGAHGTVAAAALAHRTQVLKQLGSD